MPVVDLTEYHWLVGAEATRHLDDLSQASGDLHRLTVSLRRALSATRVHLLLEQRDLRIRGREKFPFASQMFFTRRGLEQATDWPLAQYKAKRFGSLQPRWDACCGIGGDLLALSDDALCEASDLDEVVVLFASVNCQRLGRVTAKVTVSDVESQSGERFAACHIDPDRRAAGQRVTHLAGCQPGLVTLRRIITECPAAALKLAPATSLPVDWEESCEREWISTRGECRQQVVWSGELVRRPGACTATVLVGTPATPHSLTGQADAPVPETQTLGRFVVDPDPSVSAAHVTGALAAAHDLAVFGAPHGYLTGDRPVTDPLAPCFEVLEYLPLDPKRVSQMLRQRGIGRLEIKQRGAKQPLEKLSRQLRRAGSEAAALLLTRTDTGVIAILARRC